MSDRWNLATTNYASFRPEMGVPVRTSVGRPRPTSFPYAHEYVADLAPYGIFKIKALEAATPEVRRAAYCDRLDSKSLAIEEALDLLTEAYDGQTLVLLCYEGRGKGCHRRWAAGWFEIKYGIEVPELPLRPPPMVMKQECLDL